MKSRLVLSACLLLVFGCVTKTSTYTEGTKATIGAYLPYNGQVMGCQIVSYLSGIAFSTSNETVRISREHCATNSYLWGMVETKDSTRTSIETGERK